MNFLQFFQDEKGQFSATRLAFLFWSIGAFVIWARVSWMKEELMDVKENVIYIIMALMTGKVWQRYAEAKTAKDPNAATDVKSGGQGGG